MNEVYAEIRGKVGGRLVRYAIVETSTGSREEHWLDPPISNTVVQSGIDGMLSYPVVNDGGASGMWLGAARPTLGTYSAANDYRMLTFAARGNGTSPTLPSMTTLESQIGEYTATLNTTLTEYNGTKCNRNDGTITLRVTHNHETETANQTITELGWFYRTGINEWRMFSRILLPTPITIPAGYNLQTTYEVVIQVPFMQETPFNDLGVDGWNVSGRKRMSTLFLDESTFTSNTNGIITSIQTSGVGSNRTHFVTSPSVSTNGYAMMLDIVAASSTSTSTSSSSASAIRCSLGNRTSFPTLGTPVATFGDHFGVLGASTGTISRVLSAYTPGSNQRTLTYTMAPNWPSNTTITRNAIMINGLLFLLDTPVEKSNLYRLVLEYTVSWSIA